MERPSLALFALAWLAATAPSTTAHAEWTAGADVGTVIPVGEPETHPGWLVGVRAGHRFPISPLWLGPEIGAGYGVYTPVASARKGIGYGYAGLRSGLDLGALTPYLAARIGYGVASTTNLPDANPASTFSSGAFLDLTLGVSHRFTPHLELVLEGGYETIEPGGCFCARWVHGGVQGTFLF